MCWWRAQRRSWPMAAKAVRCESPGGWRGRKPFRRSGVERAGVRHRDLGRRDLRSAAQRTGQSADRNGRDQTKGPGAWRRSQAAPAEGYRARSRGIEAITVVGRRRNDLRPAAARLPASDTAQGEAAGDPVGAHLEMPRESADGGRRRAVPVGPDARACGYVERAVTGIQDRAGAGRGRPDDEARRTQPAFAAYSLQPAAQGA